MGHGAKSMEHKKNKADSGRLAAGSQYDGGWRSASLQVGGKD